MMYNFETFNFILYKKKKSIINKRLIPIDIQYFVSFRDVSPAYF